MLAAAAGCCAAAPPARRRSRRPSRSTARSAARRSASPSSSACGSGAKAAEAELMPGRSTTTATWSTQLIRPIANLYPARSSPSELAPVGQPIAYVRPEERRQRVLAAASDDGRRLPRVFAHRRAAGRPETRATPAARSGRRPLGKSLQLRLSACRPGDVVDRERCGMSDRSRARDWLDDGGSSRSRSVTLAEAQVLAGGSSSSCRRSSTVGDRGRGARAAGS